MKLNYIYHSGFAIEADGVTVIIDYYKDASEEVSGESIVYDRLLKKTGTLYVLCSHFHPDHFNRKVLLWKDCHSDIRYIFSKDILKHRRATAEDATYISKGDIYEDEHICIQAFGSTDVGISFLIELQGKRLFHAGDLNNWHWSEESTPQEIRKAESDFLAEVRDLQQVVPKIDVVMFPVDSRIGKDYMRGAEQFVERIKTSIFVPMHFSKDYRGGNAFQSFAESKGCRFLSISHPGESFNIDN
ncbi:MBL fold metallo-hydrolase [Bacteroides sp. KG68]|uniref:MBL fold metallo-hydrolase n=1 Tax=unclassified Bacteroides TaxID=2646097 RepID=UPI003D996340